MLKKLFEKINKLPAKILWGVALVVIACVLLLYENHFLWKVQEMNLFLNTTLFFKEQMVVSAGLLTWLGSFFTQFFYHPWLGVLLLCGWWWLLMELVQRTFRLPAQWTVLALIPVALLLLTIVDTGYWIYMLKLRGHVFVGTIGVTAVVALLWAFRRLPDKWLMRPLFILMVAFFGYMLMGIYSLGASVLMGIWAWRLPSSSKNRLSAVLCSLAAVLGAIAAPLLCYRYIYYQTNLANVYVTGLPLYFVTEDCHIYYVPFYLLAAFFLLLVVIYKPEWKAVDQKVSVLRRIWVPVLLIVVMVAAVCHFWFKDENYHHELAMQHHIEQLNWEGVLAEARQQDAEPTRAIVMMRNLALTRLGRQGDEMFLYRNGSRAYEAPFDMRLMLVSGPLIYYQYGMLNYCNRLCTEMCVEFNWRPEYLKLMVKCAILDGDVSLARKYIGQLRHTTFFSQWADEAAQLMEKPELIAKNAELEPITHMMHYDSVLTSDQGYVERFLMRQLAYSNYTGDSAFQEQALLATLYLHDIPLFWNRFSEYVQLHNGQRIPRFYQEAAYLYANIEDRPGLDSMPFDSYVKEGFSRFAQYAQQYYNNVDVEVARTGLYPSYGHTYYYDYYTMQNLPEY